ncbi:MAG TPA: hypothetical protein VJ802_05680 [Gemmatimonadaceae bacterium]|nr:hypothetical protein [Gemmatimonadaceae bacterium]
MSTPGSARTDAGQEAHYTPEAGGTPAGEPRSPQRKRLVRWQGLIPLGLLLLALVAFWFLFGDRVVRQTAAEAATKALGTQVDIASLEVRETESSIELRGLAIADPFDPRRNVISADRIRVELEPAPLLEKKLIIRRLAVGGVRLGTMRSEPARNIDDNGFAATTLRGIREWAAKYRHPVLALTPIDTIRQLVLDPAQLGTVRAATTLAASADSVRGVLETQWRGLDLRTAFDSSEALVRRLAGATPRTLGLDGTRRAVTDVRRVVRQIDETKNRLEALHRSARAGVAVLDTGIASLDAARRADYAFARGLLQIPSLDGPDIGGALFGPVTLDRYQQVVYWAELAQRYMPPGLRPRPREGPERLRAAGATIAFPRARQLPDFHLRNGELEFALDGGAARGSYVARLSDLTTTPALVGKPMRFSARRDAAGTAMGALQVAGLIDHTAGRVRDSLRAVGSDIALPGFALPGLPLRVEPGKGTSQLDFVRNGNRIAARWIIRSSDVQWLSDSSRARALNPLERLVGRVVSGLRELEVTANLTGDIRSPTIAISSNLDRAVAARVREVAGEEIAKAEARARAAVDRIVEERTAPVRARIAELRTESERRVADARARLDEERQRLQTRLDSLAGGLGGIPLPRG